jgi:hypothetical protein
MPASVRPVRACQELAEVAVVGRRCDPIPNSREPIIPSCVEAQRREVVLSSAPRSLMKNFSDAAFSPETIEIMTAALESSIATLPHPVSSAHVNRLAESILRTAKAGERDIVVLQRLALLELQIAPRS